MSLIAGHIFFITDPHNSAGDHKGSAYTRVLSAGILKREVDGAAAHAGLIHQPFITRKKSNVWRAPALGAVVSDALESGQVVSGGGGQYNFVSMTFVPRTPLIHQASDHLSLIAQLCD